MSKKTNNYVAFFFFLNRLILKHKEDNLSHAGIHLPLLTYSLFPSTYFSSKAFSITLHKQRNFIL